VALVLDNDSVVCEAMAGLLRGWGWQVHCRQDVAAAQSVLLATPVDLLLIDYHLDVDRTGLELWDALHDAPPTIVISADRSEAVREAVESRALVLLYKPLKPLALRSVMRKLGC
jgi:CheY-like chemotaxis protein